MNDVQFDLLEALISRPRLRYCRRGSTSSVLISCIIILILMGAGLWLAARYASRVIDDSQQKTFNLKEQIEESARQGMLEAELEEPDSELDPETSGDIAKWSNLVTTFLAQELLVGTKDENGNPRTKSETLDQASKNLDQREPYPPAVEAAIRTLLALSYRDLDRLDIAAVQADAAYELLLRSYGEMHLYSLQALRNVGALRWNQNRFDEATLIFQTLSEKHQVIFGTDDIRTQATQRVFRLLRMHESDLILFDNPETLPIEIRQLLDNPPDSCRFQTLEF